MKTKQKKQTWIIGAFTVAHCGHPTAIWPYYLLDEGGRMILSPNGLGFQTKALSVAAAELLEAGELIAAPRVCFVGRTRKSGLRFDASRWVAMRRGAERLLEGRPIVEVVELLRRRAAKTSEA